MADAIEEEADELGLSFSEYLRRTIRQDFEDQLDLEKHPSLRDRVLEETDEPQTGAA
jgi:hypothetical protein